MQVSLTVPVKVPLRLAVIMGSTREGRFCDTVTDWLTDYLGQHREFELIRVDPRQGAGADLLRALADVDAFVVVTPEYNHSFPAALKALIDTADIPWQARPVAFVSYGGISGGLRAVEQLRQVFAELHTVTVRSAVSFLNAWEQFDEHGRLVQPQRAERSAARMLGELRWWADALRLARERSPYDAVV